MSSPQELPFIDVQDLRIGMWIDLGLSWLDHPFRVSRFRITSAAQIQTLRSMSLKRVHWDPAKSDPAAAAGETAPTGAAAEIAETGGFPFAHSRSSPPDEHAARREALSAERAAVEQCRAQFQEAAADFRTLTRMLDDKPSESGVLAQRLVDAMAQKMPSDKDLCVRLLPDSAGTLAEHSVGVCVLSLLLGRALRWMPSELLEVGVGALLHDIGKLDAPGQALDVDHIRAGVRAGARMGLSNAALQIISEHHGKYDGEILPPDMRTEGLSAMAHIVALANQYDNLCNPHEPSYARTPHEAIVHLIKEHRGRQDATILGAFLSVLGIYPAGTVVKLTDGRFGLVVAVSSLLSVTSRVLVYEPSLPRDEATYVDITRMGGAVVRRAMKPAELPRAAFEYLRPSRRIAYYFEVRPSDAEVRSETALDRC